MNLSTIILFGLILGAFGVQFALATHLAERSVALDARLAVLEAAPTHESNDPAPDLLARTQAIANSERLLAVEETMAAIDAWNAEQLIPAVRYLLLQHPMDEDGAP